MIESEVLVGRGLDGRAKSWDVKGDQPVHLAGSALITQRVRVVGGPSLVRRSLPRGSGEASRVLLDNEIRALSRLSHAYPGSRPRPFPLLVGYNMDSDEPWALVTAYHGTQSRDVVSSLLRDGQKEFGASLFDAVAHLAPVGVTHNALRLESLYLQGSGVQIVSFEHAVLVGEPRIGRAGPARLADDVLDAGKVLYEVLVGRPAGSDQPDLADVPLLASRLSDVFADARTRPPAVEVLRRLGRSAPPVPTDRQDLIAGRAAFDKARERKYPAAPKTIRTTPVKTPAKRKSKEARRKVQLWVLAVLLFLALVVIAWLAWRPF